MDYDKYVLDANKAWGYIRSVGDTKKSIQEVADKRGYVNGNPILNVLKRIQITYASSDSNWEPLRTITTDLALFADSGRFLLEDRYILPVRNFNGDILAFIGWYPDKKKYITTPSKYIKKDTLFFNMETVFDETKNSVVVITEGIFDTLSAEALGYRAVGMMGTTLGRPKEILYKCFGDRFIAIPDADKQGRRIIANDDWKLPSTGKYVKWSGLTADIGTGESIHIKDLDDMLKYYNAESIRFIMDKALLSSHYQKVVTL